MKSLFTLVIAAVLAPAAEASLPNPPDTLWAVTYDAGSVEKAYKARATGDGGFIICGSTRSPGPGDIDAYVVKTGPSGDVVWSGHYGGRYVEEVFDIAETPDGGYAAVGFTSTATAGYYDVYLLRLDETGDTLWTRTYGGKDYDYGYALAVTPDGGFIIAGRTSSFGKGARAAYFIRTDAAGDTLWTRAHGGWGKDEAYAVVALPGGGYMAAGYTTSRGAGAGDVWLMKLDAAGDTVWTRTYGGELDERAEDIARTADKGFILAGRSNSFNPPYHDMYVVRVDARGDTLWTRTYGGPAADHAYSVSPTLDGGFIAAGYTKSASGGTDAYVVRCDSAGDTLWTKAVGGEGSDCARSVEQTTGGAYVLSGYTFSMGSGDGDAFLAALAPSGGCPRIREIADVPSDATGLVEITWIPSFYDDPALENAVRCYKIWRRVKQPVISLGAAPAGGGGAADRPASRHRLPDDGALWEIVGCVPATSDSIYACIAATDCGPARPRRCEGCFFVSAHMGAPGRCFRSPTACGSSIDDPAESPPPGVGDSGRTDGGLCIDGPRAAGRGARIAFEMPEEGRATIEIFSVTGRKVAGFVTGPLEAGTHSIDITDLGPAAARLAPGAYLLRVRGGSATETGKLIVLR